jgi:transglutaminase-like putative cysteine protease
MQRTLRWSLALWLWTIALCAAEPQGKVVSDLWDVVYLEGGRAGFFHTEVRELERAGQKIYRASQELDLTVKRYGAMARLRVESGTEETADGTVTGVFMKQHLDQGKQLVLNGKVSGDHLLVTVNGGRADKKALWNPAVVGVYRQQRIFAEKKAKPGDRFDYLTFEPTISAMLTVRVIVKDEEEVDLLEGKRRLLRAEAVPDKIEVPGQTLQLPGMTVWLDKDYTPLKAQTELPWVGKLTYYRTTRAVATAKNGALAVDIGTAADIPLSKPIPNPQQLKAVLYSITLKGDDDPKTAFVQDSRQEVKSVKGNRLELQVRAVREPAQGLAPVTVPEEYLASNYFLNCDDAKVKELAERAAGKVEGQWKKAQAMERWVHGAMSKSSATEFTTAGQVARNLAGDCRQHAVLLAAMCRAVGIPSRTSLGLIYVSKARGPVMGFHMWTEVWVQGQWLGLDATLGQGSVGPTHLKIADHSWHNTQSLTPMLPVLRVLGKMSIEVIRVDR